MKENNRRRVLGINGLTYRVNSHRILEGISFEIERGEFAGLIGPNGAGKTTLVKAIIGELEEYEGEIQVNGRIGYLPQYSEFSRDFPITTRQVAAMGIYKSKGFLRRLTTEDQKRLDELMKQVGIFELSERRVGTLSGGEYQRLMLVRALAAEPDLLILDEPEAGIDEMGKASFYRLVDNLKKSRNMAVLMISHDIGMVFDACDRIICLNKTLHCHKEVRSVSPEDLKKIFSTDFDYLIRSKDHFEREHSQ